VDYNSSSRHTKAWSQGIRDQCGRNESFLAIVARQLHSLRYHNTNTKKTRAHPFSPKTPKGCHRGDLKNAPLLAVQPPFNMYLCVKGNPDTGEDEQIYKQLKALERIGNLGRSVEARCRAGLQMDTKVSKALRPSRCIKRRHKNLGQDSPHHRKRYREKQRQV
jgi:hypothetical protein